MTGRTPGRSVPWVALAAVAWLAAWAFPAPATPPTVTADNLCNNAADHKYSGTVAQAKGTFTQGTSAITKQELWVNGVRRYQWVSQPGNCLPRPEIAYAAYSTTAWSDGTALTVTAKCWTADGLGPFQDTDDKAAVAWNRGYCFGNPNVLYGVGCATYANSKLSSMNHSANGPYTTDVNTTITGQIGSWGGRLKLHSVAYLGTHGDPTAFGDCRCQGDCANEPDWHCVYMEVQMATAAKSGLFPHFNFVFLDACRSSDTANFYTSFDTTSYLGWSGPCYENQDHANWVGALWDALAEQYTLNQARLYAFTQEPDVTNDSGRGEVGYRVHATYPSVP